MENLISDVYGQVESNPRPSWEYYPPGFQDLPKETTTKPGYIPHVLLQEEGFRLTDKVSKIGGDYSFNGVIIGVFTKLSGLLRYAVEDDRGVIHIYSAKNLKKYNYE